MGSGPAWVTYGTEEEKVQPNGRPQRTKKLRAPLFLLGASAAAPNVGHAESAAGLCYIRFGGAGSLDLDGAAARHALQPQGAH
eukprot:509630-Prymnesium_polylepis.1